jgi:hypothetical protein
MMETTEVLISDDQIAQFESQKYLVLRQAFEPALIKVYENYALMQRFNNYYLDDTETVSKWRYADVFGESLLLYFQPVMEKLASCKLFLTNSVLRIYQKGGILKKHVDRPTCEFSGILTIGYDSNTIYPIWLKIENKNVAINLERGDMLIYKGCEVPHWRETFNRRHWIQLFLRYVAANGKFAEHKYDGRLMIGMNSGKVLVGKQTR